MLAVVKLFAYHCHCQPLPLFHIEHLLESAETYNWEVLLAILAVALRFSDDVAFHGDKLQHSHIYAEKAIQLVMRKVAAGEVRISSLQALCLLVFVDLTGSSIGKIP